MYLAGRILYNGRDERIVHPQAIGVRLVFVRTQISLHPYFTFPYDHTAAEEPQGDRQNKEPFHDAYDFIGYKRK
jgi:hypothetical protein